MKKYISIFCITLLSLTLNAQNLSTSEGNIKGGVRFGFVGSQISGDNLGGYHKLGVYSGLFANIPISESGKWKFQMELNFIMKGSKSNFSYREDGSMSDDYKLTMLYTETPFMFQYNFGYYKNSKGNVYDFYFEMGPTLNFLFYQKEEDQNGIIYRGADELFNIFDIGAILGVSCKFADRYTISARWGSSIYPVRIPTNNFGRVVRMQFNDHIALTFCYQF